MRAAIAQTDRTGREAGDMLGGEVRRQLDGDAPHALVVFATPDQDHGELLTALTAACEPGVLVGCSSAGEFSSAQSGVGMTCVLALHDPEAEFNASLGRGLREDRDTAAGNLVSGFSGLEAGGFRYRSALVLIDALAGYADELVDRLTLLTGGVYRFFGGGAGDDARFEHTVVFHGTEVVHDAAVALEILTNKPVGIGVSHGWTPGVERMRVTDAEGMRLGSLNAMPAADVFDAHAAATGQTFDHAAPVPFFLHNVLGVESADGFRLRVPLAVHEDGAVSCAADVPAGTTSCIMTTGSGSAAEAAAAATRSALEQLDGHEPAVALLFDCVATRLRLGDGFGEELAAVQNELGDVQFAGFNTYGQIAQAEGQFSGFHNCTAVVCVLPR
ncbi:MAG: FIST C-terminal domain-containing protein [Gemmatimonadetes bacterium]|nr:FIST C-terminal domain-containing protein [Gemmatimonadota bacterium]